jgi:hypothetical protein
VGGTGRDVIVPMDNKKQLRVTLHLDAGSWHGVSSEGIWMTLLQPLGDRTNVKAIMEVDNIPFYATSMSLGDKVCIDFNSGVPTVCAIVERGGHSTYRILVEKQNVKASNLFKKLKAMGCGWEKAEFNGDELFALDIPPEVDIDDVYEILEEGLRDECWLFEEGFVGHPPAGAANAFGPLAPQDEQQ